MRCSDLVRVEDGMNLLTSIGPVQRPIAQSANRRSYVTAGQSSLIRSMLLDPQSRSRDTLTE